MCPFSPFFCVCDFLFFCIFLRPPAPHFFSLYFFQFCIGIGGRNCQSNLRLTFAVNYDTNLISNYS